MDDKKKLKENVTLEPEAGNLKLFSVGGQACSAYELLIFTNEQQAKIYFGNKDDLNQKQSEKIIYFVPNENCVAKDQLSKDEFVYVFSKKLADLFHVNIESHNTDITSALFILLYRVFVYDFWDEFVKADYHMPRILSDDERLVPYIDYFFDKVLCLYKNFYQNKIKSNTGKLNSEYFPFLVYNADQDEVMNALYENLKAYGISGRLQNISTGWVSGKGFDQNLKNELTAEEFYDLIQRYGTQKIIFRNFYDMSPVTFYDVSKIWLLKILDKQGVCLVIDSFLDGAHPGYFLFLDRNISIIALHTLETYDVLKIAVNQHTHVYKMPQIMPHSKVEEIKSKNRSQKTAVISNSRLFLLKNNKELTKRLMHVASIMEQKKYPIYFTYFVFLELENRVRKQFAKIDEYYELCEFAVKASIILRSLVRYRIIEKALETNFVKSHGLEIYGDEDWGTLFPDHYTHSYLNQKEIKQKYLENIILDPTPSAGFSSQHPMLLKVLSMNGRGMAPLPFLCEDDPDFLRSVCFQDFDQIEECFKNVSTFDIGGNKEDLSKIYGVENLTNQILNLENETWNQLESFESMKLLMKEDELYNLTKLTDLLLNIFNRKQEACENHIISSRIYDNISKI